MEKIRIVPAQRVGHPSQIFVELELRRLDYTRDVFEVCSGPRGPVVVGQDSMESVPKLWLVQ